MQDFSFQDFLIGFGLGLLVCIVIYIRGLVKNAALYKEIKKLKEHLHLKMDIDAEATEARRQELANLKKENENLRITNQALSQKPGRREVINFHIYQKAIDILSSSLVGFPPAWQKAVQEAEREVEKMESGKTSFIKKLIPSSFFGHNTISLDDESEPDKSNE